MIRTWFANKPQQAGTANILKTAEPTIVPTPKSPSVTKVPTILMNSSGLELAVAIIVAPATSSVTLISENQMQVIIVKLCFSDAGLIDSVVYQYLYYISARLTFDSQITYFYRVHLFNLWSWSTWLLNDSYYGHVKIFLRLDWL